MKPGGRTRDPRELLSGLLEGRLTLDDALDELRILQVTHIGEFARLDAHRDLRKGVPEVVYAPRKSDAEVEAIVRELLRQRGLALVSRLEADRAERLRLALAAPDALSKERGSREAGTEEGLVFEYNARAGLLVASTATYHPPESAGCVGVLTGGTADVPVAEEAALVATHMGCRVEKAYDVGVAGVHRLLEPLTDMIRGGADVLVVAAGMEGALPSVVAGLVDLPVIGVPTSGGYGFGGDGTAALYSVLQSCSPGLLAVNIDNGVGAGAAAGLIARRRAR